MSGTSFITSQHTGIMWRTVLLVAAAASLLATFSEAGLSVSARCPEGQFYSFSANSCQPCALCPKNQIIRMPCTQHSDTVCGPFFEFYKFHQAGAQESTTLDRTHEEGNKGSGRKSDLSHPASASVLSSGDAKQRSSNHPVDDPSLEDSDPSLSMESSVGSAQSGRRPHSPPSVQTPEEEESQWKVLALALIIVLCVVCIFLLVFIFVVCYLRAGHAGRAKNAALFGTGIGLMTSSDRSHQTVIPHYYVQVPARTAQAHSTASGPGEISPATVCTTSGQPQEGAEHGEPEGGGRTHATAGSEYVYFKSPHNGNHEHEHV